MELSRELREMYIQTAEALRGSERRIFMAQITRMLGVGGQRRAESELGWNRGTIRKGMYEIEHGKIVDDFSSRGRKSAEFHLPNLLIDIEALLADRDCSAAQMRQRLITEKGYDESALPGAETIRKKIKLVKQKKS